MREATRAHIKSSTSCVLAFSIQWKYPNWLSRKIRPIRVRDRDAALKSPPMGSRHRKIARKLGTHIHIKLEKRLVCRDYMAKCCVSYM